MATKKKEPLGLHAKILLISEEMGFLSFDKKNKNQGYSYASAAGVIRKLQESLIKHGVTRRCTAQQPQVMPGVDHKSNLVTVSTVWEWADAETGQTMHTCSVGQGKDSGDKAAMKAATASMKYDIAHTLCLAWGAEDPEASDPNPKVKKTNKSSKDVAALIEAALTVTELEAVKEDLLQLTGPNKTTARAQYVTKKELLMS